MKKRILYRSLKNCYKSSPSLFVTNSILTIVLGFGSAANVYVLQNFINSIQLINKPSNELYMNMLFFLIVSFLFIIFEQFHNYVNQLLILKFEYFLELEFIRKCCCLELGDFENEETYNLITKAQNLGQSKLINVYNHFTKLTVNIISIISVISIILIYENYYWIIVLIVPVISFFINRKLGKYSYEIERNNTLILRKTDYIKYLLTNNIAIKEVITFRFFDNLLEKFKYSKDSVMKNMKQLTFTYIMVNGVLLVFELLVKYSLIIIFIISSLKKNGLIGDIMGFIYSMEIIQSNFMSVFNSFSQIYKDRLYVEDYFLFMDLKKQSNGDKVLKNEIKNIEIKNLRFSYNGKEIIRGLNLDLDSSHIIVLVGENGSGKSTLIKLMSGLYNNYEGHIYINGTNLKELNKEKYRENISVIFQDFNKYELTMRDNIAMSSIKQYDDKLIFDILDKVDLREKVFSYKDGIDTQMGKWFGGEELSKGQWQRIAIARVLFHDSSLILMDEPNSALDPEMERKVLKIIAEEMKNKIVVLATHKISNLLKYDPYFVFIKDGKIYKEGTKDEVENLLKKYE